jgi:CheY-like chemotaxis protein
MRLKGVSMGSGKVVLIVESDQVVAARLTAALRHEGHVVATASRADQAMRVARIVEVAGLVTEMALLDADGCDLLRDISAMYPVKAIAIGVRQAGNTQRARAAGFDTFVAKPSCTGGVIEAIKQLLGAPQAEITQPTADPLQNMIGKYNAQLERLRDTCDSGRSASEAMLRDCYIRTLAATRELALLVNASRGKWTAPVALPKTGPSTHAAHAGAPEHVKAVRRVATAARTNGHGPVGASRALTASDRQTRSDSVHSAR